MPSIPQSESVLRTRYVVVAVLRATALVVLVLWAAHAVTVLIDHRVFGPSGAVIRAGLALREPVLPPIVRGLPLPVLAMVAAAIAPRLARLLVPMPRPGCPFCDHEGLPETGPNCPECGRELPAQLLRTD